MSSIAIKRNFLLKSYRQFIFCMATALTLMIIGSLTAAHNPYYWVLYVVASLLSILSISGHKQMRSRTVRQAQSARAD